MFNDIQNHLLSLFRMLIILKNDIKKEWNKSSVSTCQQMIDKIPARLKLLIDQDGNQIQEH